MTENDDILKDYWPELRLCDLEEVRGRMVEARTIVEEPGAWTRGDFRRKNAGWTGPKYAYCAIGAIKEVETIKFSPWLRKTMGETERVLQYISYAKYHQNVEHRNDHALDRRWVIGFYNEAIAIVDLRIKNIKKDQEEKALFEAKLAEVSARAAVTHAKSDTDLAFSGD